MGVFCFLFSLSFLSPLIVEFFFREGKRKKLTFLSPRVSLSLSFDPLTQSKTQTQRRNAQVPRPGVRALRQLHPPRVLPRRRPAHRPDLRRPRRQGRRPPPPHGRRQAHADARHERRPGQLPGDDGPHLHHQRARRLQGDLGLHQADARRAARRPRSRSALATSARRCCGGWPRRTCPSTWAGSRPRRCWTTRGRGR